MVPVPGTEPAGHRPPQMLMVVVGIRLVCITVYIFSSASFKESRVLIHQTIKRELGVMTKLTCKIKTPCKR